MTLSCKFRLTFGVLICVAALFFLVSAVSHGPVFPKILDGMAWLSAGFLFCFSARFQYALTHRKFILLLGLLVSIAGLYLTVAAVMTFFGSRPHGLEPFYELIGIGPLFVTLGFFVCLRDLPAKKSLHQTREGAAN